MKQKTKLTLFVAGCLLLVTASLYAGRHAYSHCGQCHFTIEKTSKSNILTGLCDEFPAGIKP